MIIIPEEEKEKCSQCEGTGYVWIHIEILHDYKMVDCQKCSGKGKFEEVAKNAIKKLHL